MAYKVVLSSLFLSDLREIVDYLNEHAGPAIAIRIGNELLDRALEVGHAPFVGPPVKLRPGARKVMRYPYLIYYDVNASLKTVEVLRVWHGARDPKTLRLDCAPPRKKSQIPRNASHGISVDSLYPPTAPK